MRNGRRWFAPVLVVTGLLALGQPADDADIRDQLDPIPLAEVESKTPLLLEILGGVLVLAAIGLAIRQRRKSQGRTPEDPEKRVAARLAELRTQMLPARTFYAEAHLILVDYLTHRSDAAAKSCTSVELLATFRDRGFDEAGLHVFLTQADHARFSGSAGESLLPDQQLEAIELCRRIIQSVALTPRLALDGKREPDAPV